MNAMTEYVVILTLLGSGIVSGVFFAFSSFVMKSLGRLPSSEGIAAMQSINVVVINPSFLGAFMGTALLSGAVLVLTTDGGSSAPFFVSGALLYIVGTFLVTVFGNVPLNNRLAVVNAVDASSVPIWEDYLVRWTRLNTVRTTAAAAAAFLFAVGLAM
jgi:uncharacterized membrane protein